MDPITSLNQIGFKFLRTLGEGAYGKVVLVENKVGRKVAIKIIDKKATSKEYFTRRLTQELLILRKAKHPHIIEVHKVVRRYGHVYIVMDFATTDLWEKIQKYGPIPSTKCKKWFSQLLSAVAYLHRHEIVHRDIKCDNILLTADEQVKLTDFSLARIFRGRRKSKSFMCTTDYAAPEVIKHQPYDPKKSDVYSLGVVLYEMVSGHLPYKDAGEAVEFPSGVTKCCRTFISLMLKSDPDARPTVEELKNDPWLQKAQRRFSVKKNDEDDSAKSLEHVDAETGKREEDLACCGLSTSSGVCVAQTEVGKKNKILKEVKQLTVRLRTLLSKCNESEESSEETSPHNEVSPIQSLKDEPLPLHGDLDAP